MPEPDHAVSKEQVDRNKNSTCHPKRNVDREIDQSPVGGQRSEGPGTENVKDEGADNEQDQNNS
jgi:hypothetical protein